MDTDRCVVVLGVEGPPRPWEGGIEAAERLVVNGQPPAAFGAAVRSAVCALVDGEGSEAVQLVRSVYQTDPSLQVAIVVPPEERPRVERSILFSPGLGEVWLVSPDEVDSDLTRRAATVTRQRRAYRSTHARVEHDLAVLEPHVTRRALVSDAYLASLLSVIPDPVLSVDAEGKVLSWSGAAEAVLGYSRIEASGQPLTELLGLSTPLETLESASRGARPSEISFRRRRGDEGLAEIWVVPVEAGGHSVRAVVLHDVTEERRAQADLEEQAGELEAQATELEASQIELEMSNDDLQRLNAEMVETADRAKQARNEAEALSRRLEAVLHQMPSGVILAEAPSGKILLGNEQVERIWRAPFLASGSDGYEGYQGYAPGGEAYEKADWPIVRSLLGERVMDEEIEIVRGDGSRGTISVSSTPIENADGEIVAAVAIFDDITERREHEDQLAFLAEAGRVLGASLEYRETLETIARLAVPRIADWCAVDVVEDDGLQRVAVVHSDPSKEELAHEIARRWPTDLEAPGGLAKVLRTGESELMPTIPEELLTASAQSEEHLSVIRELGLRSGMIVPLVARGRPLGAITLVAAESGREYTSEDLVFAEQLASRAAFAVDNARLMRSAELAREAAEEARAEAESANRAKSEFLANMSHEIRTPINAIMGYTDLLQMGLAGPVTEEQGAQLERVRVSSRHLLGLIEDILDLAKVEAGRMDVVLEHSKATDAVTEAIALVGPQAAEKSIEILDRCAEGADAVYVGDEARVRQIIVNLLSNAVKFTEPGGEIRISCGTDDADAAAESGAEDSVRTTYIRVEDTGIGIAADEMESVFRPFEQVEKGRTRVRGGTGLGLTISRQLARLMGGDLTVESELGRGSVFTLRLRADPPDREDGGVRGVVDGAEGGRAGLTEAGIAAVGRALAEAVGPIMAGYRDRLRRDGELPDMEAIRDAELEAHASTLLAHMAKNLIASEDVGAVPDELLHDGLQIQRVISDLHGAQRARLGWNEAAIDREFTILREEIAGAVTGLGATERDMELALELLTRSLEEARAVSVEALRHAREGRVTDA